MKRFSGRQLLLTLAGSALFWAVVAGLCMLVGSSGLVLPKTGGEFRFRAQSVLLASLIGASLAAAGVAYQAVLRNPLADPYLLGVSSGAMLGSYLWRLPGFTAIAMLAAASQQGAAFAGAAISVGIVFILASRRGRIEPVTLLLVGVIVNATNASIFLLIDAIKPELTGQGGGPTGFLVGGIQTNLQDVQEYLAAGITAAGLIALQFLAPSLNVAGLSDAEARSLGVRAHRLRWVALLVASLMTASAVAISGPIGFVGLVCPHLARLIVGHDVRRLVPLSAGLGAALLASADAGARLLSSVRAVNTFLPVGVLTGLLGGPFFLILLYRQRRNAE